ncbi:MAG TPA: polysaccharide pyruvyl transferase CsaB [Candidatus Obscuribacterales bacterium]
MSASTTRELVVVSGYYGFDNLGDEAILEELTNELKQLTSCDQVVVLSANPQKTARLFAVKAEDRMDLVKLHTLCKRARLFVSGGGGLFQDTSSPGSVLFYGMQMLMAKGAGAQVVVYAQGIGPLKRSVSRWMARKAFSLADAISVRDEASQSLLKQWGIDSTQTADPVWCLEAKTLPVTVEKQLAAIKSNRLIGLSLRESANLTENHLSTLVQAMSKSLPSNAHVILLPLQANQDKALLQQFARQWSAAGRESTLIDTSGLQYPAEWIALLGRCKLVVAMRLHALIMALKAGVGVVGIPYDPKVSQLLSEFEQPALILTKDQPACEWEQTMTNAVNDADKLARRAIKKAEGAKKLACQNFNLLAKILGKPRNG